MHPPHPFACFREEDVIAFPAAIPGFPGETAFFIVRDARSEAICYLQSARDRALRFLLVPAAVDPGYRLELGPADMALLFPAAEEEFDRTKLAAWFIVSARPGCEPTVNKLAPIVVRVDAGTGVQAVRTDMAYSHEATLEAEPGDGGTPEEGRRC